jgi:hypothetical protein
MSALGIFEQIAVGMKLIKSLKAQDDLFVQVPSMPPASSALIFFDRTTRVRVGADTTIPEP